MYLLCCVVGQDLREQGRNRPCWSAQHLVSSGILSVKQRCAVKGAVSSAPHTIGSQIHANLENFGPCKRVPFDSRSQNAGARLVRTQWQEIMEDRVPGIGIDGTDGCMNRLHESLCLETLIARHNDPDDEFHMDEHQVVCVGHQFKHGVTFMTLTTLHSLNNMARADNPDAGPFRQCNQLVQ
jgi:hypothetical protein